MTTDVARDVLARFRPGMDVAPDDVELRSALELAQTDEDLGRWFHEHCQFQEHVRTQVRSVPAAVDLKARILARQREQTQVVQFPQTRWRRREWLALAAAIVLAFALAGLWLPRERPADSFADYRARMVRTVLREYRMDIRAADMRSVRDFMTAKGAPADYIIPGGLAKLPLAGGGFLRWRNQPVAMVCFRHGANDMSYLFVMARGTSKDAPPAEPEFISVNGRSCASWSSGDRIYLLTGAEGIDARTLL